MHMPRTVGAVLTGAALVFLAACNPDLNVPNPNTPDVARAVANPNDVQNLALSAINSWYVGSTQRDPWVMLNVTSDVMTMNYGNFGARFNNLQPRIPYANIASNNDAEVAQVPWDYQYATLGEANKVLKAVASGTQLPGGTAKYAAIAQWAQAGALMQLALIFDKAFPVDENFDPTKGAAAFAPYDSMSNFALGKINALISATNGQSWTYTSSEFPAQGGLTAGKLNRLANTMAAQLLAYTPRTAAEAAKVNWGQVLSYAQKGIGTGSAGAPFDFVVVGDANLWWSEFMGYFDLPSWMMVNLKLIHQMAPNVPDTYTGAPAGGSAGFDALYAPQAPYDNRLGIDLTNVNSYTTGVDDNKDFQYARQVQGDPNRGIYMQSPYYHTRYIGVSWQANVSFFGPMPYTLAAENDLLQAEALIRTGGDRGLAAQLVNNTRVGRGGLTPLTATDNDATFLQAITYEREVELLATDGFGAFAMRHMDQLSQPGSCRQLPVPASELETDNLPVYTCGGATQDPTGMGDMMPPTGANAQLSLALSRYEQGPSRALPLPDGEMMTIPVPQPHRAPGHSIRQ